MKKQHSYKIAINWTGNKGSGTSSYSAFGREHEIIGESKPVIPASSDPAFRGDKTRYNPEELLVASLSSCHMLWYLHLCSENGVIVVAYREQAIGLMIEMENGSGHFKEVTLKPEVTVTEPHMIDKANELHKKANEMCFIANSCNFPVHHEPTCKSEKQ